MPFKSPGGGRIKPSGEEFSNMFTTAPPGELRMGDRYNTHNPASSMGGTTADPGANRRSMQMLDRQPSPVQNPDDIFKPAGRRLVGKGGRPQTAKPQKVSERNSGRPISASVYKGSYF